MLRRTLEAMVQEHKQTLQLDLSRWSIAVHQVGGGRRYAHCSISRSGDTVVR
jgi:hypothetical protein